MSWIRAHAKVVVPAALVSLALVAYLAFGVFGVHTLFFDDEVDEAGPVFASGAAADAPVDTTVTVPAAAEPAAAEPADESATDPAAVEPAAEQPASEPVVVTLFEGSFVSRDHPGEGRAVVLNDGSEQRFLRFEDFATDNGPDLNVYLTTADAAADQGLFDDPGQFVDLGDLKGNIGEQNYEIPTDVDLSEFDTVVVWCVRFSVAFTAADLAPVA